MSYLSIQNLYKNQDILLFEECYALEKIHGTSAHLTYSVNEGTPKLTFFSGGAKHETFVKLFNQDDLLAKFATMYQGKDITVYGEAYGGSMQGMSKTYGPNLKFVAFDVKVGESWLSVPQAEKLVLSLGLEFVHYVKIFTTLDRIDEQRDTSSVQAIRNGMGEDKMREGVILRPLIELTKNNGDRIICKHKRDEFMETKTPREVSPEKLKVLEDANAIADEWVVTNRLEHVANKLGLPYDMAHTKAFIVGMLEDVKREAVDEIVWSKEVETAIGRSTAKLLKQTIQNTLTGV